ncbi:MAG: ABC transporter permease [Thermodesulforhabdaceae bacterium]
MKSGRRSYWGTVWLRLRRNRIAMIGLIIACFFWMLAVFAPLLANDRPIVGYVNGAMVFPVFTASSADLSSKSWKDFRKHKGLSPFQRLDGSGYSGWVLWPPVPYSPTEHDLLEILSPPGKKHWFGTDDSGRDVLSRMIYGARVSLSVGVVAVGIAAVIGIILGGLAGYFGGWVDALVNRIIEILLTIPTFFLIIAIIAFLPPSIYNIMVVIGLTGWTGIARFVRAEFLKLKAMDFVLALKALGASPTRIIFVHMLPNAMAPVLVAVVFGIAGAILTESGLSFLGFGVPPPTPSWGDILSQSRDYVEFAWWLTIFPGAAIFLTITAYNVLGEGLRDAMDPKLFR